MRTPIRLRVLAGALSSLVAAISLHPRAALACSVCLPGDPSFSAAGASAQPAGSVSLYTEFRSWQKVSGALPHAEPGGGGGGLGAAPAELHFEKNQGQRLDFYLGGSPIDRVSVALDLPIVFSEVQEIEAPAVERLRTDGLGDIALSTSLVLWRDREVLPATWLEARAMLEFPTGESGNFKEAQGDPHVQSGSGSWDFGFGVAVAHRLASAALYASAFYRENTEGSLDYVYGDVVLATAAAEVPLGHLSGVAPLDVLVPGLALDFRYAERDHFEGLTYVDSGGSILYASPSLRVRIPWLRPAKPPSLRVAVQIPLVQRWLYGFQEEGRVWSAGLLVPF